MAYSVLDEHLDEAKVFARRGAHRAEELLDKGKIQIKRHPAATAAGTFVVGLGLGILMGWVLRRK